MTIEYHLKNDLLQFNVAQLMKERAEASRLYFVDNAIVPLDDADVVIKSPISGQIRLVKVETTVLVTGTLHTTLELPCTRCLKPVDTPVTLDIEETFNPVSASGGELLDISEDIDPATLIDETHILDMTEVVRQNLYVCQPTHILCREDCKGLCATCGHNLNESTCNCQNTAIDSRWAGLLAFKDE